MPKRKKSAQSAKTIGAMVGYEAELWQMSDTLGGSVDASDIMSPEKRTKLKEIFIPKWGKI